MKTCISITVLALVSLWSAQANLFADDSPDLVQVEQQALNRAVEEVAGSVVQIRTVGGADQIGRQLLNRGPTTGLIVSDDGYVVSSVANFAGQPTSILVRTSEGEQFPAELVGRDNNRMLALLKIETTNQLPVPQSVPKQETLPGQWAVAVGRVFDAEKVNVSVGVISARNRMHGRVLQTDASVSTANYGGPLVDIRGRVFGVLVPMAPQPASADVNELAGVEYYDSGIGFAVPLEDIIASLPRWKEAGDLHRGLLGIGMKKGSAFATPATITNVWPTSPAKDAGWKAGDTIIEVDGNSVGSQTQLRFQITPRYAGDTLKVLLDRAGETIETEVTLTAELAALEHAFLGILPGIPEPEPSVEKSEDEKAARGLAVRAVWPGSPAQDAGLIPGDQITKLGDLAIRNASDALRQLSSHHPGDSLNVTYRSDDKERTTEVTLGKLPVELLKSVDLPNNATLEPAADWEQDTIKLAEFPQETSYYLPQDTRQSRGLLVWLEGSLERKNETVAQKWRTICLRDGLALAIVRPASDNGWNIEDLAYVKRVTGELRRLLKPAPQRMVVAGNGKSGQMALRFAFANKGMISGVAAVAAPLPRTFETPANQDGERLAVLAINQPDSPFSALITRDIKTLREAGYPAGLIESDADSGQTSVMSAGDREKLALWIDTLNRM
ncbi:PDZ domain-containing protein [Adhaeretor mobilis]|uniref:Periplasmic serine endoprotease DegP n=1 Tax=Adhaeretor mobilis TaxID=1930276 RepID=A0A517MX21_9BACT|nr:PDZ domain-containing protein [Adhaeretor mobilis]QDS99423.1 Periplasmic serine endoprotease DegP precursor [Adhaeretor mobilis]